MFNSIPSFFDSLLNVSPLIDFLAALNFSYNMTISASKVQSMGFDCCNLVKCEFENLQECDSFQTIIVLENFIINKSLLTMTKIT